MTSDNPARDFRRAFERVQAESMAGLPLLNDTLRVDVIGFVTWRGRDVGVLITPWCVNLVVIPAAGSDWRPPAVGTWRDERFPGQEMQLLGGEEPEVGAYAFRSLLSPVTGYDDHDAVRAVAREVLKQLLAQAGPGRSADELVTGTPEPRRVSRRGLLRGG